MSDHEIEQAAAQPVCLRKPEQPTEADPVRDHHPHHRQPEEDAECEGDHRDPDVVGHDQPRRLDAGIGRDVSPELVVMHSVDQPGRGDRVSRVGVGQHHEVAHDRGDEHEGARSQQEGRRLAIGARERLGVESANSTPRLSAPPVHGPVTPRDQSVQVSVDGLAGPVALGSRKIRGRPPIECGQHQYLCRLETVEVAATSSGEQVLEPVPVVVPEHHEILSSHYRAKIT